MSVDNLLFLNEDKLPAIAEWQAALDAAGTGMTLEDVGDLRKHTGYFPLIWNGKSSGFEWYFSTTVEMFPDGPPDWIGGRDSAIDLVTFGDMQEFFCALTAGGILGRLCDAVVWEGVSPEAWLREAEEAKSYLK